MPETTPEPGAMSSVDRHLPAVLRDTLFETERCVEQGLLIAGTACADRGMALVFAMSRTEGASFEARVRALQSKFALYPTVVEALLNCGDVQRRRGPLSAASLGILVAAVRAAAYDVVIEPQRLALVEQVTRLVLAAEPSDDDSQQDTVALDPPLLPRR